MPIAPALIAALALLTLPALPGFAPDARAQIEASAALVAPATDAKAPTLAAPASPISPDTPEGRAILRGIRLNFEARHEDALEVAARLQAERPDDPWPAVLETYTLFWLMLYEDEDTRYDERIERACERTIELAKARLEADPDDPEAHFLMGQGLMNSGRLHGWRGRYYKAGRDGEKARKHLERTLELRPDWVDARFQLGLYYFFASMLPDMMTKWLGWLWFIPTGNADEGIAFIEQVAEGGVVYGEDARYMTANIYAYYVPEKRERAAPMIREIAARYPDNVLLHFEQIELLYESGLAEEAAVEAERLAAREPRNERERGWITIAPVWQARVAVLEDDPQRALELLTPYLASPPDRPLWGNAWIDLVRGQALDVLGRRDEALAQYERVLAYEKPRDSQRAARLARESIETPYTPPRPTEISAAP